jgi:hypothetical protein
MGLFEAFFQILPLGNIAYDDDRVVAISRLHGDAVTPECAVAPFAVMEEFEVGVIKFLATEHLPRWAVLSRKR